MMMAVVLILGAVVLTSVVAWMVAWLILPDWDVDDWDDEQP